ncbi:hypothetical protein C8R45DRAFT_1157695 [Mycena sanguinolenta]|nr:hypothetical protein C8R45DRAFT_1157695 [Mycena sanguinolenta]
MNENGAKCGHTNPVYKAEKTERSDLERAASSGRPRVQQLRDTAPLRDTTPLQDTAPTSRHRETLRQLRDAMPLRDEHNLRDVHKIRNTSVGAMDVPASNECFQIPGLEKEAAISPAQLCIERDACLAVAQYLTLPDEHLTKTLISEAIAIAPKNPKLASMLHFVERIPGVIIGIPTISVFYGLQLRIYSNHMHLSAAVWSIMSL